MDLEAIKLEGLTRLMQGPSVIERPVTLQQYKLLASVIFHNAFAEELVDPTEYVLLLAWRITRQLALGYNIIGDDEALQDIGDRPSWVALEWCRRAPSDDVPSQYHDRESGLVPQTEEQNSTFSGIMDILIDRLQIRNGSKNRPYSGRVALKYLSDRDNLHHYYPNKHDIIDFEEQILRMVSDKLVTRTHGETLDFLRNEYGLTHGEISSVVKTTHGRLGSYADMDNYTAKGVVVARLNQIAAKAELAGDIRAEISAVKSLAVIHGVVQNTGGRSTNEDFLEAVDVVTAEADLEVFPNETKVIEA